jgi:hypothetical protein
MRTSVFGRLSVRSSPFGLRVAQFVGCLILWIGLQNASSAIYYLANCWSARQWLPVTDVAGRVIGAVAALMGGAAILTVATLELRRRRRQLDNQAEFPDQPWRWQHDWAAGKIRSSSRFDSWLLLGAATTYLLVCLPLGLLVINRQGRDIISLPGIVMLVFAWAALNLIRQRTASLRSLDCAEFKLAGETGVIGGPLYGAVALRPRKSTGKAWRLSLECVEFERSISKRSVTVAPIRERVLWRDESVLQTTLNSSDPATVLIPVYFAIPFSCLPTQPEANPAVHWFLKVGPNGGETLTQYARFEVPVFVTNDSTPDFQADPEVMSQYEVPLTIETVLPNANGRVESRPNGTAWIHFSLLSLRAAIAAFVLAVLMWLIAIAVAVVSPPMWSAATCTAAGLIMIALFALIAWRSDIEIGRDEISVTTGVYGFRRRVQLAPEAINLICVEVEHALREQSHYRLRLQTHEVGPGLVIARRIKSRREASVLADWLVSKLPHQPTVKFQTG